MDVSKAALVVLLIISVGFMGAKMQQETPESVMDFWFQNESQWFSKNEQFDQKIQLRFHDLWQQAKAGEYQHWESSANGVLALIIIFDQFPRNMFRGTTKMYATDKNALQLTKKAITVGINMQLDSNKQRLCLYMPLIHSEVLADQERGVMMFSQLENHYALNSAKQHHDIIKSFGRFPHRNEILNRTSSAEELEFLTDPKAHF